MVQECSTSLLAGVCAGVNLWCMRQEEPGTHTLLATHPHGKTCAGPLLRYRIAFKKNIRGVRRLCKTDGARSCPGADSTTRQLCATHVHLTRETFKGVRVLELCFDASQVSIRNHDIFTAFSPELAVWAHRFRGRRKALRFRGQSNISGTSKGA